MEFQNQLNDLQKLNLSAGQYMVVGSGALSVRNIRESEDVDVIVTQELWNELSKKHSVSTNSWGIENIVLEKDIEILNPAQSIFGNSEVVPIEEMFKKADVFEGVAFINLDHLRKIKIKLGREKDLEDVRSIDAYLRA